MKNKKALCAFLLLISILTQSSCGFIVFSTETSTDTDTEPPEQSQTIGPTDSDTTAATTPPPESDKDPLTLAELARLRLDALPDRDFSQAPVIIATTDNKTICPTDTEDILSASRADCERAVEEKFNTTIIAHNTDAKTMLSDAKEAYLADMYYAELMVIPQSMLGSFFASDILVNMNSLPHTNYSAEHYNSRIIEAASAGDKLYAVSGAANFNPEFISCVYFNRTLAKDAELGDLYELVRDGKWTWDKLREFSLSVSADLEGVAGLGSAYATEQFIDLAATANGVSYTSSSVSEVPSVNYLDVDSISKRAKDAVDTLYNIIYKDVYKNSAYISKSGDDIRERFVDGSLLFCIDNLALIDQIFESDAEWGILPLPKYDESQKDYLSLLSPDAPVFCAIEGISSYENAGLVLEALNVASYGYVLDVYKNDRIDYYLRDSDSISMLSIICDSPTTDFAHMYASGFNYLSHATYKAMYSAVTSHSSITTIYNSYKSSVNRELSKSITVYE